MPFPPGPSGLGPDWKIDTSHKSPNDERYVNPAGDKIDWHKGRPGAKGWDAKDHWHWVPGGKKEDWHYNPGETVKKAGQVAGAAAGIAGLAGIIQAIIDAAPFWGPVVIF